MTSRCRGVPEQWVRRYAGLAALGALVLAACGTSPVRPAAAAHTGTVSPSPAPTAAAPTFPLTGLPAPDPVHAARPALSIKIDNVAGALPQRGLNDADLVVDALVEGGLTRLFAVYQSHDAPAVGPIRSARPVDADLLRLLGGGLFAYSGASPGEIAPTLDHGNATRIWWDNTPRYFFTLAGYAPPHNVFASTATLYRHGALLAPHLAAPPPVFRYSTDLSAGQAAPVVTVPMSGASTATWTWDGHRYLRAQNGRPDVLADGSTISTGNVVVLSVAVRNTDMRDAARNPEPLDVVIGSGPCWVLRDGGMTAGTWERPTVAAPMLLRDAQGRDLALRPGRTWLELLPRPALPTFR